MSGESILLAAVGDISFKGEPGDATLERGVAYPFAELAPVLADADVRFGNMESVLVPQDFPQDKLDPRALCSSDAVAPALREAGFDVLNMASNHVLDCGTVGLDHTRKTIGELGVIPFGAGLDIATAHRPAILEVRGLRVGFLGYQEDCNYTYGHVGAGCAYLVESDILRDMEVLRPRVDVLVLSLHADLEFVETPAVWRRDMSRRLAEAGADLILEHHPHVPQGVERVGKCLIAYSMGNCLFAAHTSDYMKNNGPHTGHSFVLKVRLSRDGAGEFERVPFDISQPPGQRPVPVTGDALAEGVRYLEHLDAQLADDDIVLKNWRARCMRVLGSHLKRVGEMTPEQFMAHTVWQLTCVQENRAWTSEILRMAEERFAAQAREEYEDLQYQRPSRRFEAR